MSELDKLAPSDKEAIMQAETSWEARGMQKTKEAIALKMLRKNLPLETVAEITELTIAELQQLQATQASS
jgi:predicted transposase YdaD